MTKQEQEEIKRCLSCPLPECINCLAGGFRVAGTVTRMEQVRDLSEKGMTDRQMGDIIGIHPNTVMEIRKKLGIPNLRERTYGRAAAV